MWIMTNRGFISVVSDRNDPTGETLLVRARQEAFFKDLVSPVHAVFTDPEADYPWRALMSKTDFMDILAAEVAGIDYPNFKNSVKDDLLHGLYSRVWSVLAVLGCGYHRFRGGGARRPTIDLDDQRDPDFAEQFADPDTDFYLSEAGEELVLAEPRRVTKRRKS